MPFSWVRNYGASQTIEVLGFCAAHAVDNHGLAKMQPVILETHIVKSWPAFSHCNLLLLIKNYNCAMCFSGLCDDCVTCTILEWDAVSKNDYITAFHCSHIFSQVAATGHSIISISMELLTSVHCSIDGSWILFANKVSAGLVSTKMSTV
jgi:hypothetical protein